MYNIKAGTVQPMVVSDINSPHFIQHFGMAEYYVNKSVVKDYHYEHAQPIVNKMNKGIITENEARNLLSKI